jgi:acyl-CoA synthetase (AMP-forming)/AMP-acid ligase II
MHGLKFMSNLARYSPAKMVDFVVGHHVSSCIFTSTQAQMLLNAPNKEKLFAWKEADSVAFGGEMTPLWFLREFYRVLPHATLYHAYAPSETTVVNILRP